MRVQGVEALGARLDLPISIDNDANAALWAEHRFGAARGTTHAVMITLGTGIGGAILVGGHLVRGRYGIAGEFGHMQVVPGGQRCECGNRGCWEQYSSGNALVREARGLAMANSPMATDLLAHVGGDPASLTGPMITEAARAGDATATELLADLDDDAGALDWVVAEVRNTYGGRHCYVVELDDHGIDSSPRRTTVVVTNTRAPTP